MKVCKGCKTNEATHTGLCRECQRLVSMYNRLCEVDVIKAGSTKHARMIRIDNLFMTRYHKGLFIPPAYKKAKGLS